MACAKSTPSSATSDNPAVPPDRFRILTYNVLHGLDVGRMWVRPGESAEDRTKRFQLQFQHLARAEPDVMLLQEVNPLPTMADAYVEGLKSFGLEYRAVHQADACGIRLGPKLGLVPGLNNGLAVLVKSPLRLRKLTGLKLSGGIGGCGDIIGFQTGALRYALIAEVEYPETKAKMLAVSLHLHSGIERSEYFTKRIIEAKEQGKIENLEDFEKLLTALAADQSRRIQELRTLLQELRKRQEQDDYLAVVIGGDFNFEPHSPEYQELMLAGLQDSHMIAEPQNELHSYDPSNPLIDSGNPTLPTELIQAIQGLPESRQRAIVAEYRRGISQARRIDFLFTMPARTQPLNLCVTQKLFGTPTAVSVETGSDHYGVHNTYLFDRTRC
jgi:endonuclease/exonuclease/phosphatase family metal-dependent hydrolase